MSVHFASESMKQVFHIAQSLARENYNETYSAAHCLRALMHPDIGQRDFLLSIGKDPGYFMEWADIRIAECAKAFSLPDIIVEGQDIDLLLDEADEVRIRLGADEITPLCVLAAITKPHIAFSPSQLKSLPLKEQDIITLYSKSNRAHSNSGKDDSPLLPEVGAVPDLGLSVIQKYCIDKTAMARSGRTDPITGREKETRALTEILGRRNKPNVIITGAPGVGKTALIDGFAYEINNGNVPLHLQKAIILELDSGALMAGASYKGEVEDRLKKIIAALKQTERAILFIDEIHQLLDSKGSMGSGVANLLKPELARGEITVIGATTQEEYRKIIEPEQAFNRRFEVLAIEEPDFDHCCNIVSLLVERYEKHHQIRVDKKAIPECVRLSKRYIKDKKLPDSALDLLDRTMSAIRMLDETSTVDLKLWKQRFDILISEDYESVPERIKKLKWSYQLLQDMISPILWGSLQKQPTINELDAVESIEKIIEEVYQCLLKATAIKREQVGKLELAAVMAAKTGIPIGKIQSQEKDKLLRMEAFLQQRVVGQDHALKILSDAVIESRSGINKQGQPIGSFFLLGPTGTGKTELAKSMAALLFNDEKAMIRFDMSEFKEEHSAALLYGAPPGYIGYEEGGMLVNKIREQPYAVVLFDEIEKAHPSVFDVFLQIMDEGKIQDKMGKEGDFSNALILFTSNLGSDHIVQRFEKGLIPESSELIQIMASQFRPEFLARLTEIVPFAPINEHIAERIFRIHLKHLTEPLSRMGIDFSITDQAVSALAISGFNSAYGARQISGVIRSQLSRPVSKMIVREEVQKGNLIEVGLHESGILTWNVF